MLSRESRLNASRPITHRENREVAQYVDSEAKLKSESEAKSSVRLAVNRVK